MLQFRQQLPQLKNSNYNSTTAAAAAAITAATATAAAAAALATIGGTPARNVKHQGSAMRPLHLYCNDMLLEMWCKVARHFKIKHIQSISRRTDSNCTTTCGCKRRHCMLASVSRYPTSSLRLTDWSFLIFDFLGCLLLNRGHPLCDRQLLVV